MEDNWLVIFAAVAVILVLVGIVIVVKLISVTKRLANGDQSVPRRGRRGKGGHRTGASAPPPDLGSLKEDAKDQKKLFQEFINERPEILDEPKKTQFDEFRQWREKHRL